MSSLSYLESVYEYIYSIPVIEILQENFTVISISLYLLWYLRAYLSTTTLLAKEGSIMANLTEKMPSIHSGYRPTFWCAPSAFNTVIFAIIQRCIKHPYKREVTKTEIDLKKIY